jgi:hypothetical protein
MDPMALPENLQPDRLLIVPTADPESIEWTAVRGQVSHGRYRSFPPGFSR